ncbi:MULTISPECIES: hypothetical protein [Okeania]|uniref:hypothetical protein n=1 Tax=Okeania TaxID=1458928 RepID=UPI001374BE8C|nr:MULTISPECIES: hypothetical protein [Okeania]NET16790.1 hypothetical protein [Okeania sp. SIO1H6]NES79044.1 hypothetical protein [Okeania sp. SIO1H4]NET18799.1 hypothetical protein [Okeania sp. SIO1H5]NET76825.1 hypothetical protein [Okeania sp. SIO1F9]NET97135.1 hypothetical protein [Okeania sp. SIO1H2]
MGEGRSQESGDNPPLAPPPPVEGKTGEMGIIEEVRRKNSLLIFLRNYAPKMLNF